MAIINSSMKEEIRNQVNIVDVISEYVNLSKSGRNYQGLCPFHAEKTPSFTVNEEKQFFYCYGCHKNGDVFKFVELIENIGFREALVKLARRTNIKIAEESNVSPVQSQNQVLYRMYDATLKFYKHILTVAQTGEAALQYLKQRELTDATIDKFDLGFAPKNTGVLREFLLGEGYQETDFKDSGLFFQDKNGEYFEMFRNRLIFPVKDESGKVIAFSGRKFDPTDTGGKYINSPETAIFKKNRVLYNFDQAKISKKEEGHLILFEGYMDVIAADQAGIYTGIASMGTSLTNEQIYQINRVTDDLILVYDGDEAGVAATNRAINLFKDQNVKLNVSIVNLPEQLDPDEFIKKYGPEKFSFELNGAKTPLDYQLEQTQKQYNLDNDREKISYVEAALKLIATEPVGYKRDIYLKNLADLTQVSENSLKAQIQSQLTIQRKIKQNTRHQPTEPQVVLPNNDFVITNKYENAQSRLLNLVLNHDEVNSLLISEEFVFPNKNFAKIFELWQNFKATHDMIDVSAFLDTLPDELSVIVTSTELREFPVEYSDEEINDYLQLLQQSELKQQLADVKAAYNQATAKNDTPAKLRLLQEMVQLKRRLE